MKPSAINEPIPPAPFCPQAGLSPFVPTAPAPPPPDANVYELNPSAPAAPPLFP